MISANGVEYKNLPEQVQYLTEKAAGFAVELDRVSTSVESVAGDVAALQTSYTTLAEDVRIDKVNINTIFGNLGTIFTDITNIKNGTTHLFETITDSHGNKRFVEGNGTPASLGGLTITYNKWSLSGSHLMVVICGEIEANTNLTGKGLLYLNDLPDFIKDKLFIAFSYDAIDFKTFATYVKSSLVPSVNIPVLFIKDNTGLRIQVRGSGYTPPTADTNFRIQFDLVVDAS